MKICVVASCSSNSIQHTELSWHSLPKDEFQRDQWIDLLGLKDAEVTDQMRVCSLHFKPKDFCINRKALKFGAVPSVRLGRGKFFKDDSDDEYYPSGSASDDSNSSHRNQWMPLDVDAKPAVRQASSVKAEVDKNEGDLERSRPSRRAARLAAEKIMNTVRKYGLSNTYQKKEEKIRSTSVLIPYPDIDLLMECHDDNLTAPQAEALLKAQLEYNMVVKMLRTLKASNARIIHVYADTPENPEVNASPLQVPVAANVAPANDSVRPVILHPSSDFNNSDSSTSSVGIQPANATSLKPSVCNANKSSTTNTRTTTVVLAPRASNVTVPARLIQNTTAIRPNNSQPRPAVSTVPIQTSPILVGQPQTALQLLRTVPQQQAILITTNSSSGVSSSGTPVPTTTSSSSLSYKVLVDSRTGIVVGTLPSDTTILQSPDPTTTTAESSSTTVSGSTEAAHLIQVKAESCGDRTQPPENKDHAKSQQSTGSLKQIEKKTSKTPSQDKIITLITGGFKMVTAQTLLSVKPCPMQKQECMKDRTDKLRQQLKQEKFTEEPVKWLIKLKLLPDQPLCRWCTVGTSELVPDKAPMDGYCWSCCNPQCKKTTPVARLTVFSRFGIPLSKLLSLTYHWAMQSNVEKVLKSVDVDIYMVRSVWRALQEVCARALTLKAKKLGGEGSIVEVAIAQIGRFFILGALERKTSLTRLKTFSISIGWNSPVFHKGLEPWLAANTLVTSDDPKLEELNKTGFKHVIIDETIKDKSSNGFHVINITDYLKTQLSDMFGKFWVNQLKLETVQGFLDELQWRERYGISPVAAFWNILSDIAEQSGRKAVNLGAESDKEENIEEASLSSSSSDDGEEVAVETSSSETTKDKTMKRSSDDDTSSPAQKRKKKGSTETPIALDEYYYARMEPDPDTLNKEEKKNYQYKCHLCKKILDNNIKVMKHINCHIENSRQHNLDLSDLTQCKYCFRDFDTPYSMQCHIEAVHLKTNSLACHICNQAFSSVFTLTHHMKMNHFQSEMPYACQVCMYRSSFHREVLEHFQQVHSGTDKVQCHYCLRVYTIKFSTVGLGFIQNYYNHMYKHQLKSSTRKCPTCCLVFLNYYELKDHKLSDHLSMKDRPGVVPMKSDNPESLIVINPNEKQASKPRLKPSSTISSTTASTPKVPPLKISKVSDLSTLQEKHTTISVKLDGWLTCIECKSGIDTHHFRKYVSCGQCLYATNCTKAFVDHMICLHSNLSKKRLMLTNLMPVVMLQEMHCICGFVSNKGNLMAQHLVQCGKKSCYSSLERVLQENVKAIKTEPSDHIESQSAFFPPLVVLDENEEASINESFAKISSAVTEDTKDTLDSMDSTDEEVEVDVESTVEERPDMLNALGLVRKQSSSLAPSTPSTQDENSNASQDNINSEQPMDVDATNTESVETLVKKVDPDVKNEVSDVSSAPEGHASDT